MNLFEAVKAGVTARKAAEAYGIRVNRSGMACCPFHNDRTPSMKLDERFHCFGCGVDGDVINLVARLYGLSNKAAAEKLAADFGISFDEWKPRNRQTQRVIKKKELQTIRYEETLRAFYQILTDYYHMLLKWKEDRAPKSQDEDWDPYFCEALNNLPMVEYLLDAFLEVDDKRRIEIMNTYGRKVKGFESRLKQYRSETAGRTGRNHEAVHGDESR